MNGTLIILLVAIVIIGVAIMVVIAVTSKTGKSLDVDKYQRRWLAIESGLKRTEPASYQMTILNADKLLDMALKERAFKGQTMGERMKSANDTWKNADHVWGAHKIRNKIAHESDVHITYEVAARSLVAYKQALRDLGAF